MEIKKINPQADGDKVQTIAEIYQKTFGEAPWNETWLIATVLKDFYCEMKKPGSVCLIACEGDKIIGFAWGYDMTSSIESDYHLQANGLNTICPQTFFYLDEVAVSSEFQSRGIGKKLVAEIIREQGNKAILLRTLSGSQMHALTASMGGKVIMPVSKNRIIVQLRP